MGGIGNHAVQVGNGAIDPVVKLLVEGVNLAVLALRLFQGIGGGSQRVVEGHARRDRTRGFAGSR
jgi:hypothetical protein